MFKNLIRWTLKNRLPVFFVGFVLITVSIFLFFSMPETLFPRASFPRILITIEKGYAPIEYMEISIVKPLENTLRGVEGTRIIRSKISRSNSEIQIYFDWKMDMDRAFQLTQAKISEVRATFPSDTKITVTRMNSSAYPISGYALYSKKRSLSELRDIAEFQIRPVLTTIGGIYKISILGGNVPELLCELDPYKMARYNISPFDVKKRIAKINSVDFLGPLIKGKTMYLGFAPHILKTKSDVKNIIIARRGLSVIHLSDIARVRDSVKERFYITTADWHSAVLFHVLEQPGTDSVSLSKHVEEKLNGIKKNLPDDVKIVKWYDLTNYVSQSISGILWSIFLGFIIISITVFIFFKSFRLALPVIIAIPLTALLTIILMKVVGYSLNLMTLGAISAGAGIIVDNAVVVVDNIIRHKNLGSKESTVEASAEIIPPMLAGVLTTVVAFIPILTVTGVTGLFFKPLAITLSGMVFISLILAIFITPSITAFVLPKRVRPDGFFMEALKNFYGKMIKAFIERPFITVSVIFLVIIAGIFSGMKLKTGFLPVSDEGSIVFDYHLPPGTSLMETDRVLRKIEHLLKNIPEVRTFSRRSGYGLAHPHDPNEGDMLISLKDKREKTIFEIMKEFEKEVKALSTGIEFEMFQVIPDRLGDLIGKERQIVVKIYGNNYPDLEIAGKQIEKRMKRISGLSGVRLTVTEGEPEINMKVKRLVAREVGLSAADVGELVKIAIWGERITGIKKGLRVVDIRMRYPASFKKNISKLKTIPIYTPLAGFVPLGSLASLKIQEGEDEIIHENGTLLVTVTAESHGRDLGSVISDIKKMLGTTHLPVGVSISLGGDYAFQLSSFRELLFALFLSALFVLIVLLFEFREWRPTAAVFLGTLLSFCVVTFGLWLTGTELNISSFAGIITVLGIVVNNGILFIDFAIRKIKEDSFDVKSALVDAGRTRLRPILITNLTTIAGFMPIALRLAPGSGMLAPFSITVIFGLVGSIGFSLFVIPFFYFLFEGKKMEYANKRLGGSF